MGMFDRLIDLRIQCPRCKYHSGSNYEIQTKDLTNMLDHYYVYYEDSNVLEDAMLAKAPKYRSIDATFSCSNPSCSVLSKMQQIMRFGYVGHGSLNWNIRYKTNEKGLVCGPAEFLDYSPFEEGWDEEMIVKTFPKFMELMLMMDEYKEERTKWANALGVSMMCTKLAVLNYYPDIKHEDCSKILDELGVKRKKPNVIRLRTWGDEEYNEAEEELKG